MHIFIVDRWWIMLANDWARGSLESRGLCTNPVSPCPTLYVLYEFLTAVGFKCVATLSASQETRQVAEKMQHCSYFHPLQTNNYQQFSVKVLTIRTIQPCEVPCAFKWIRLIPHLKYFSRHARLDIKRRHCRKCWRYRRVHYELWYFYHITYRLL